MSDAIVLRLVWKEYRVQRGFWLAIFAFAVLGELLVVAMPAWHFDRVPSLFLLALACPAFYALGCGATLYAAEREEGTLEQLRILAAPTGRVFWSKLGFALVSTATLVGLLWLLAFGLARGETPAGQDHLAYWSLWGVAALEFLAWGLFFSLLTKRPLNAACLAGAIAVTLSYLIALVADRQAYGAGWRQTATFWIPGTLLRCLVATFVLALDGLIAQRWVLGRPKPRQALAVPSSVWMLFQQAAVASLASFIFIIAVPELLWFIFDPVHKTALGASGMLLRIVQVVGERPWGQPFGLAAVEAVAWGTLFALWTRRRDTAVLLASIAGVVNAHLVAWLVLFALFAHRPSVYIDPWLGAAIVRVLVILGVSVLDFRLIARARSEWAVGRGERVEQPAEAPSRAQIIGRLVWQEWRQAWPTMLLIAGVTITVVLLYPAAGLVELGGPVSAFVFAGLASLMGSCVFLAEQEGKRFRFLAERAVAARRVWRAKHLVWFSPTLVGAWLVWLTTDVVRFAEVTWTEFGQEFLGVALVLPLIGYCSGQFASMLIPRGLVAGTVGLIVTAAVSAWLLLIGWLGASPLWSVLPLPIAMLLATWVRAPDWMTERGGWRPWLRLGLVLIVPVIGLPVAVSAVRVYEIPAIESGFSLDELRSPATAEERETAAKYREAFAALASIPLDRAQAAENRWARDGWEHATESEKRWLEANSRTIELTLEASRRPGCVFHEAGHADLGTDTQTTWELARLLMLDARRLEAEGDLDAALERYLAMIRMSNHVATRGGFVQFYAGRNLENEVFAYMPRWATQPGQTAERIRHALRELEKLNQLGVHLTDAMKAEYVWNRELLSGDLGDLTVSGHERANLASLILAWRLLPSEQPRALRLLDQITAHGFKELNAALAVVEAGQPLFVRMSRPGEVWLLDNAALDGWVHSTPVFAYVGRNSRPPWEVAEREIQRRALLLILAIKGWQVEHGGLPEKLDDLLGSYFDRMPLDPHSGRAFGYAPAGFPTAVRFSAPAQFVAEPGRPLLWSSPAGGGHLVESLPIQVYRHSDNYPDVPKEFEMRSRSNDVLGAPWAFPIP